MIAKPLDPEPQPLLLMLIRHGWKGVLPCIAATAIVVAGSLFWPKVYQAEATFEVRNESSVRELLGAELPMIEPELKQTLVQDVAGRLAIEQVIDDLGLIEALGAQGRSTAIYEAKRRRLSEEILAGTRVHLDLSTAEVQRIRVTVEDHDPIRARDVANRLVENYIERGRERARESGQKREAFLQKQVDRYARDLAEAQARLTAFKIEHPSPAIISPSRWSDLQAQSAWTLLTAQAKDQSAAQRMERLARMAGTDARNAPRVDTLDEGERLRLQRLLHTTRDQLDVATGLQGLGADHRKVQALQEQIRDIENRLSKLQSPGVLFNQEGEPLQPDVVLTQAWEERQAAAEELRTAKQQAVLLEEESGRVAPVMDEYRAMQREAEVLQGHVAFWEGHLLNARRASTEEVLRQEEAITLLSPAGDLQYPKSPVRQQVLLTAVAAGLATGVLFIFLAVQRDTSYARAEDAEQNLSIPILGELSLLDQQPLASRMWQAGVWRPVGAAVGIIAIAGLMNLSFARLSAPGGMDGPQQDRTANQTDIQIVPDEIRSVEPPIAQSSQEPILLPGATLGATALSAADQ